MPGTNTVMTFSRDGQLGQLHSQRNINPLNNVYILFVIGEFLSYEPVNGSVADKNYDGF